jgi:diacylglycerol kinase family enzyme
MGTMNLLARDLGVPTVLEHENILDLYKCTGIRAIDVGMANDRPFLCCAAIGTIPEASVFREAIRNLPDVLMVPRLTAYVMDRMDVANMRALQIQADGREMAVQTAALVISNNRFAHSRDAAHRLAKNSLQDGMLGIYSAAPQTLFERLRLLLNLQQGKLETEPSLQEAQATTVYVRTENDEELVSIDGEPVTMKMPISFRILSGALKLITPAMEAASIDPADHSAKAA